MASLFLLFKQASYDLGDQYKFTLKPPCYRLYRHYR